MDIETPQSIHLSPLLENQNLIDMMSPSFDASSLKNSMVDPNEKSNTYYAMIGNFDKIFSKEEQAEIKKFFAFEKRNEINLYDDCFIFSIENGYGKLNSTCGTINKKINYLYINNEIQKAALDMLRKGEVKPTGRQYRNVLSVLDSFAIKYMGQKEPAEEESVTYRIKGKRVDSEYSLSNQIDYIRLHVFYCIVHNLITNFV